MPTLEQQIDNVRKSYFGQQNPDAAAYIIEALKENARENVQKSLEPCLESHNGLSHQDTSPGARNTFS